MIRKLCFVEKSARIEIPDAFVEIFIEGRTSSDANEWAVEVARNLNTQASGIVFMIGKLCLSKNDSQRVAYTVAHHICTALKFASAPENLRVEIDHHLKAIVSVKQQVRTLLPHHDGGHCSYLTPSILDDNNWDIGLRRFSNEKFFTTQAHKLYQGIFIIDPGEGLSVTTYYDWLAVLCDTYTKEYGTPSSVRQVTKWLGRNIYASLAMQHEHKGRYLTIGGALGAEKMLYHGITAHFAEAHFTQEEIQYFPELQEFEVSGSVSERFAMSPTEQFFNKMLLDTTGLTWDEFRAKYEICVPSERYDFVLAHNLTLLHGGLMGGSQRMLEPICIVTDTPSGKAYEEWLAAAWRRNSGW